MITLEEIVSKDNRYNYCGLFYRNGMLQEADVNDFEAISWSDLKQADDGDLFVSPFMSYGDYDSSCHVERSNYRVFLEQFKDTKGIWKIYGAFGGTGIAISIPQNNENQEMVDCFSALNDYPAIDDGDVSYMELEMEQEDWESWIKHDLIKAIENKMGEDYEIPEDFDLFGLYLNLKEVTNNYYIIESGGVGYINIDKLMNGFTKDMMEV
jgi:hypothetical protein